MTEWDASEHARIAAFRRSMAGEVLWQLDLRGTQRVRDLGCGNGKVTAEIAARLREGTVVGVDSSVDMIAIASANFAPAMRPNLRFPVADIQPPAVSRGLSLKLWRQVARRIHDRPRKARNSTNTTPEKRYPMLNKNIPLFSHNLPLPAKHACHRPGDVRAEIIPGERGTL
jgi:SAM-dependent methyltransferase